MIKKYNIKYSKFNRKIHKLAGRDSKCLFERLSKVVGDEDYLKYCYENLKKKVVGKDGIKHKDFDLSSLAKISNDIRLGQLKVSEQKLPYQKGNRVFQIANLPERICEKAFSLTIQSIFEPNFFDFNYGARSGYGQKKFFSDLNQYQNTIADGYIVKADIQSYFSNITIEHVYESLSIRISDSKFMKTTLDLGFPSGVQGLSQGSPLSLVLANIVGHHYFDKVFLELHNEFFCGTYDQEADSDGIYMMRYIDDIFFISSNSSKFTGLINKFRERIREYGFEFNESKFELLPFGFNFALGLYEDDEGVF